MMSFKRLLLSAALTTQTAMALPWVGGRLSERPDGRTILTVRSENGAVAFAERKNFSPGGWSNWDAWTSLEGVASSDPITLVDFDSRALVLARGSDDALYFRKEATAGRRDFQAWVQVPRTDANWNLVPAFIGEPALVRNSNGLLTVLSVAADGKAYAATTQSRGGVDFGPWVDLGAPASLLEKRSLVAAMNANGTLSVFASGKDAHLWYRQQKSPGGEWNTWTDLGFVFLSNSQEDAISVAVQANNRLIVIVNNGGATVSFREQTAPSSAAWSNWANLIGGSHARSRPLVARQKDGRLSVFWRVESRIDWQSQTAAASPKWNNWKTLVGAEQEPNSRPVAFTDGNGVMHVIALGFGHYIHEIQQTAPNADTWTDWTEGYFGGPFGTL